MDNPCPSVREGRNGFESMLKANLRLDQAHPWCYGHRIGGQIPKACHVDIDRWTLRRKT